MKKITNDNNELALEKEKQKIINSIDKKRSDEIKRIINNYSTNYSRDVFYYTTEIKNGGTNGN